MNTREDEKNTWTKRLLESRIIVLDVYIVEKFIHVKNCLVLGNRSVGLAFTFEFIITKLEN